MEKVENQQSLKLVPRGQADRRKDRQAAERGVTLQAAGWFHWQMSANWLPVTFSEWARGIQPSRYYPWNQTENFTLAIPATTDNYQL